MIERNLLGFQGDESVDGDNLHAQLSTLGEHKLERWTFYQENGAAESVLMPLVVRFDLGGVRWDEMCCRP